MKQSRWMSLVEAVANVLVGYGVAVATQWAVFPLFGLHATLQENLLIGLIFTVVSLIAQPSQIASYLDRTTPPSVFQRNLRMLSTLCGTLNELALRHSPSRAS